LLGKVRLRFGAALREPQVDHLAQQFEHGLAADRRRAIDPTIGEARRGIDQTRERGCFRRAALIGERVQDIGLVERRGVRSRAGCSARRPISAGLRIGSGFSSSKACRRSCSGSSRCFI
jgi:hypothetical protein